MATCSKKKRFCLDIFASFIFFFFGLAVRGCITSKSFWDMGLFLSLYLWLLLPILYFLLFLFIYFPVEQNLGFPGGTVVKNLPPSAEDTGLISGLGRFPGEGNSNTLQYSCLENPMDSGAWRAMVHGVTKSWTWLSDSTAQHRAKFSLLNLYCILFLYLSLSALCSGKFPWCYIHLTFSIITFSLPRIFLYVFWVFIFR